MTDCGCCGQELTPPNGPEPYGPEAAETTDCGGDCLRCMRTFEYPQEGE